MVETFISKIHSSFFTFVSLKTPLHSSPVRTNVHSRHFSEFDSDEMKASNLDCEYPPSMQIVLDRTAIN